MAAALLAVATTTVVVGGTVERAAAIDQDKGYPGFCRDAVGVTVVIDFQQLGGETYVRCNPQRTRGTGLDALKGAGFQIEGVRRWGESFICRIENRPSAVEGIAIDNDPGYREQCIDTPPATAYWSYWHAGNNCPWSYSQWGVKNRDFVQGGFEGWSFSLNASADDNPLPRIAPVRPGTEGGACTTAPEAPPKTDDPDEKSPGTPHSTAAPSSPVPGTPNRPGGATVPGRPGAEPDGEAPQDPGGSVTTPTEQRQLPPPKRRGADADNEAEPAEETEIEPERPDPATNVSYSGGEDARDVRDVLREQQGGQRWVPWIAAVAVAALAAATFVTGRRRRQAREA